MYGLSEADRDKTFNKIKKSKEYIETHGLEFEGKFIPFAVLTKNAWHNSHKYVAELQNRVNSLTKYATDNGLVNIFITLTLPSEYHPTKTLKNGKLVHNPKFTNDLAHTPKAGSKVLSSYWKRILDFKPLQKLSRENRCYFRVTEPHKSGTPHLHISLFVPKESVERVFNSIFAKFTFPQIEISSQYIPSSFQYNVYDKTLKREVYKRDKNDNFGISENIKNPTAYMMKYILKTLDDLREDGGKMTDITLWYILHGIGRFYTSRTLLPLYHFRKINYIEKFQNIYEATVHYKNGRLRISGTKTSIDFLSIDENGEIVEDTIWTKQNFNPDPNFNNMRVEDKPVLRIKKTVDIKIIPVEIDGENYILKNGLLQKPPKPTVTPAYMKDKQLYDYYHSLDIEDENITLLHYGITQNEMVKRGFLDIPLQNLNDYNLEMEIAL